MTAGVQQSRAYVKEVEREQAGQVAAALLDGADVRASVDSEHNLEEPVPRLAVQRQRVVEHRAGRDPVDVEAEVWDVNLLLVPRLEPVIKLRTPGRAGPRAGVPSGRRGGVGRTRVSARWAGLGGGSERAMLSAAWHP